MLHLQLPGEGKREKPWKEWLKDEVRSAAFAKYLLLATALLLVVQRYADYSLCHLDDFFLPYLLKINRILADSGIQAWISAGALLGFQRGGRLLQWDYDLDYYCLPSEISKLKSRKVRKQFADAGLSTVYGRGDFIWDKWAGNTFRIEGPALRFYTVRAPFLRFHVEFFDMQNVSLNHAVLHGFVPPLEFDSVIEKHLNGAAKTAQSALTGETRLLCSNESKFEDFNERFPIVVQNSDALKQSIDSGTNDAFQLAVDYNLAEAYAQWSYDRCFLAASAYPLQTRNLSVFKVPEFGGESLLLPKDISHVLRQFYGDNWMTPRIKGWKRHVCFEFWTPLRSALFRVLVSVWICALFARMFYVERMWFSRMLYLHLGIRLMPVQSMFRRANGGNAAETSEKTKVDSEKVPFLPMTTVDVRKR